ncbi:MAG: PIN domain-containing protein [Desulfobacterales bacterium]|nr:PIN domain-containing protein [Desulfobacterales bacterium]
MCVTFEKGVSDVSRYRRSHLVCARSSKAQRVIDRPGEFLNIRGYLRRAGAGASKQGGVEHPESFLQSRSVPVLHVDENISSTAMFLGEQHHFSHALDLPDALVAATALIHGLHLLTADTKHSSFYNEPHAEEIFAVVFQCTHVFQLG